MKQLTAAVILCLWALTAGAILPERVQNFEIEGRAGVSMPVEGYHGGNYGAGPSYGFEVRYNVPGTKYAVGVVCDVSALNRTFVWHPEPHVIYSAEQRNRTIGLGACGEYNFRQGRTNNPYISMAVGAGLHSTSDEAPYPTNGATLWVAPRFGVEFYHHIRVSMGFNLSRRGYNNFAINVGLVLGGRPK